MTVLYASWRNLRLWQKTIEIFEISGRVFVSFIFFCLAPITLDFISKAESNTLAVRLPTIMKLIKSMKTTLRKEPRDSYLNNKFPYILEMRRIITCHWTLSESEGSSQSLTTNLFTFILIISFNLCPGIPNGIYSNKVLLLFSQRGDVKKIQSYGL